MGTHHKNAYALIAGATHFTADKTMLLGIKAGDGNAFDALYEKYWERVYVAAFKRLQDTEQATDITQDVFLQLWLNRETSDIENLPAYLYTAVKNKVFTLMEKESKYILPPGSLELATG